MLDKLADNLGGGGTKFTAIDLALTVKLEFLYILLIATFNIFS